MNQNPTEQYNPEEIQSSSYETYLITKILFSFQGRISRNTFWAVFLSMSVLGFFVGLFISVIRVSGKSGDVVGGIIFILYLILSLWVFLAIGVKRFHDIDYSGWSVLLFFVPIVSLIALGLAGFTKGTTGTNKYGEEPFRILDQSSASAEFDTDNPPWGLKEGLIVWFLSVVLLFIVQTIFVIPLFISIAKNGQNQPQDLLNNPTFVLLVILSAIPTHLLTAAIVWSVVTNWHKKIIARLFVVEGNEWNERRPFVKWLGLEWNGWAEVVAVIGVAFALFFIAGLSAYFIGGGETDIDRMLKVSANARYALAFVAAFTAPLAEELIYRGILYPAARKTPGVALTFIGTVLLCAVPLLWISQTYKPHTLKILVPALICFIVGMVIIKTSLKEHRTVIAVGEVSMLFALVHVPQYIDNLGVIIAIIVLSVGITTVRAVTGRLFPCIILHFIFNGVQAVQIVLQPNTDNILPPQQGVLILKTILYPFLF